MSRLLLKNYPIDFINSGIYGAKEDQRVAIDALFDNKDSNADFLSG